MSDEMDYETRRGQIRYNPETIDQLGVIRHDGITFLYNRMDEVLQIENEQHGLLEDLQELVEEWRGNSPSMEESEVYDNCADELEEVLEQYE